METVTLDIKPTIIRVRYSDSDRMGLVYHVNYLEYFELARSDWIRQVCKPYREIEDAGYYLVVIEANLRYLSSAYYDDLLEVKLNPREWGKSRVIFDYEIIRTSDKLKLCTGFTKHCFTDKTGKIVAMPAELSKALSDSQK